MPLDMAHLQQVLAEAGSVLVQYKLKGMHLLWDGWNLLSAEGKPLPALAHIRDWLINSVHMGRKFEGEAYLHGLSEAEIIGRCHRAAPDAETKAIQMHVFDVPSPGMSTDGRMSMLNNLVVPPPLAVIPAETVWDVRGVRRCLEKAERQDFEGIVIRDPRAPWQAGKHMGCMKWKPRGYDQYEIIGIIEGPPGEAAALIVQDRECTSFKFSGLRLTRGQRKKLWERRDEALGKMAWVSYCGADEDGHHAARVEKILDLPWLAEKPTMHFQIDLDEED
jgi:DNA ligase-1